MQIENMVRAVEEQGWQFHNYIYCGEWVAYESTKQAVGFVNSGEHCWFVFTCEATPGIHQIGTVFWHEGKLVGVQMVGAWEQVVRNSVFERIVRGALKGE